MNILPRLQQLWERLQFDTSKTSLVWLLPAINVALVLLVIAGISASAIGLLRDLANEQGMTRVQLAGTSAREELRKLSEDILAGTRSLATTPTLRRLLFEDQKNALEPLLQRNCQAKERDACAITRGTEVMVSAGAADWNAVLTAMSEQGERFMMVGADPMPPVLGAAATVFSDPAGGQRHIRVIELRAMDDKLAAVLQERVGVKVQLINYRAFTKAPQNAFTRLHSAALSDGRYAAERIDERATFAASVPVFAATGEAIALIFTELSTDEIDASVQGLIKRLLITALVLAALAVFASVTLGQQVVGPVRDLTDAALRLGQGDFSTSIPARGAAEVGALARTMEDMRRNLVELTGALRRREAEAQAVLGGIVEGVYAVDRSRIVRYMNPQAARLLGVLPEEAVGRFCGDVLKPNLDPLGRRPCDINCPILHAREAGHAQATEHLMTLGGSPRTTVITSSGLVEGLQVQVIRDETQLEAARRARDSVLANISHEFRTPLAAQLASIELLREQLDTMSAEQRRELVLSLERGTLRLTRLIDNLLESVRIESGQLSIRHQNVLLQEVIDEAVTLIGGLLTQRRQTLDMALPEDLPQVDGDALRLTQVFVNLLANASKFAPEDSTIRVGAALDDGRIKAWVEDEGEGPPEIASGSIFDRFSRGPAQEPEPGGLGLGLWIVKSIIDRHGGTITAERTSAQRTRFTLTLPVVREDEEQA